MTVYLDRGISRFATLHDTYVQGFAYIERVSSKLASYFKEPVQRGGAKLKQVALTPLNFCAKAAKKGISKTIQLRNRLFGYKENDCFLKSCNPLIKDLQQKIKMSLYSISLSCSLVFDHPFLIAQITSQRDLALLVDKLNNFINTSASPSNLLSKKLEKARKSISEIHNIQVYLTDLEQLYAEELSDKDFVNFQKVLESNQLLQFSIGATLENVGEFLGGKVVEENALLPSSINPTVLTSSFIHQYIGLPVGRLFGFMSSAFGVCYLIENVPFHISQRAKRITQVATLFLLLYAEYYEVNPLSNNLGEICANIFGDLGFYSVGLLFNYLGMWLFGTNERLPDYVAKMTPSMIVYDSGFLLLEKTGLPYLTNFFISFYFSHVAYNFQVYKSAFQGTILKEAIDKEKCEEIVIQKSAVIAREALTAICLDAIYTHLSQHLNIKTVKFCSTYTQSLVTQKVFSQVIERFPPLICAHILPVNALATKFSDKKAMMIDHLLRPLKERCLQVVDEEMREYVDPTLTQIEKNLLELTRGNPQRLTAFFLRSFNDFFTFLNTPEIKLLIQVYNREIRRTLQRSKIEEIDIQPYVDTPDATLPLLHAALQDLHVQQLTPNLSKLLLESIKSLEIENLENLEWNLENSLNEEFSPFFPLILPSSTEDEFSSVMVLNILKKVFLIRTFCMLSFASHEFAEKLAPIRDEDVKMTAVNFANFIFYFRRTASAVKSLTDSLVANLAAYQAAHLSLTDLPFIS